MADWKERAARAAERHDDGLRGCRTRPDERQRQLTRMGNAAWAAGLSLLMLGGREEAAAWLTCAAERYAAALARLVLGEDAEAVELAATLQRRDDFPQEVAETLVAISVGDRSAYEAAIQALLADFETRDEFLEDIRVADTVLVLQELARVRDREAPLVSPLLPA